MDPPARGLTTSPPMPNKDMSQRGSPNSGMHTSSPPCGNGREPLTLETQGGWIGPGVMSLTGARGMSPGGDPTEAILANPGKLICQSSGLLWSGLLASAAAMPACGMHAFLATVANFLVGLVGANEEQVSGSVQENRRPLPQLDGIAASVPLGTIVATLHVLASNAAHVPRDCVPQWRRLLTLLLVLSLRDQLWSSHSRLVESLAQCILQVLNVVYENEDEHDTLRQQLEPWLEHIHQVALSRTLPSSVIPVLGFVLHFVDAHVEDMHLVFGANPAQFAVAMAAQIPHATEDRLFAIVARTLLMARHELDAPALTTIVDSLCDHYTARTEASGTLRANLLSLVLGVVDDNGQFCLLDLLLPVLLRPAFATSSDHQQDEHHSHYHHDRSKREALMFCFQERVQLLETMASHWKTHHFENSKYLGDTRHICEMAEALVGFSGEYADVLAIAGPCLHILARVQVATALVGNPLYSLALGMWRHWSFADIFLKYVTRTLDVLSPVFSLTADAKKLLRVMFASRDRGFRAWLITWCLDHIVKETLSADRMLDFLLEVWDDFTLSEKHTIFVSLPSGPRSRIPDASALQSMHCRPIRRTSGSTLDSIVLQLHDSEANAFDALCDYSQLREIHRDPLHHIKFEDFGSVAMSMIAAVEPATPCPSVVSHYMSISDFVSAGANPRYNVAQAVVEKLQRDAVSPGLSGLGGLQSDEELLRSIPVFNDPEPPFVPQVEPVADT